MTYDLIVYAVIVGCVLFVVGALIYAVWLDHEDAKREAEHRRFLEVIHRTPRPFHEKAAQGFHRPETRR